MHELIMLGLGILLTIATGLFVASEFSLVNLDRAELEARQNRGERRLGITIRALRHTSTHLSSAQLGITLTTLLAGFALEPAIASYIRPWLVELNWPEPIIAFLPSFLAVALATLLSMIVGELVPKNFALALPLRVAKIVLPFQVAFTAVFRPAVAILNGTANAILRSLGVEPKEELSSARTAEELRSLVQRSAREGSLDHDTATLLSRTLQFNEHLATDVMTPRPKVVSIPKSAPAQQVIELSRNTGYSRFPVVDDGIDDVVGLVHLKQAVAVPLDRRQDVPVSALATQPLKVPETMRLDTLLGEVKGRGYQLAIVIDEYGGTAGVVTLEDLAEELVGEVSDEHDRSRAGIVKSRDWLTFPGMLRPDELLDRIGVSVPEDGPYETVAGFIMSELGRLPKVGDEVSINAGSFRVERMDGRRVDRIRFTPAASREEAEE